MRRTIATLLSTGLLAAAGCGDDEESTGGDGGGEGQRVVLSDFAIEPKDLTLEPGKVTFDVVNEGKAPHRLEIKGRDGEFVTETLEATGDETTLEADLKGGTYEWYCPIGKHAEQGMKGTLTVGDGGGAAPGAGGY